MVLLCDEVCEPRGPVNAVVGVGIALLIFGVAWLLGGWLSALTLQPALSGCTMLV